MIMGLIKKKGGGRRRTLAKQQGGSFWRKINIVEFFILTMTPSPIRDKFMRR